MIQSRCPMAASCATPATTSQALLSRAHSVAMGTKSRDSFFATSVRMAAQKAVALRRLEQAHAGLQQPSPTLGDALNAGYIYREVRCLGCDTHQTVALDIVRRPKTTPVHELERYMRCRQCSEVRGYAYKRSHLVALRTTMITASTPPSRWTTCHQHP
jgi:hypothetical protein